MGLMSAFRRSPAKEGAAAAATVSTTSAATTTSNGVHDSPPVNDIGGKVRFVFLFSSFVGRES